MTRITKTLLRIWISATSIAAFAIGWAALAHAPKPAALVTPAAEAAPIADLPALDPIPSLSDLAFGTFPDPGLAQNFSFNLPRLRARGS